MSILNLKEEKGGYLCDICGEKIIVDAIVTNINPFVVKGIDLLFHAHDKCLPMLKLAADQRNWKILPDGPLKEAYYMACKEQGKPT